MLHLLDPEVDAGARLRLVEDFPEIIVVETTDEDGWFLASEEMIAEIEDVALPEVKPRWPYLVAVGFMMTMCACVAVSL